MGHLLARVRQTPHAAIVTAARDDQIVTMDLARIRRRVVGGIFRPFGLRTSDGRGYAVRHPGLVLVGPRSLAVLDRDGEIVMLDPLHVVAIKDLRLSSTGRSKR